MNTAALKKAILEAFTEIKKEIPNFNHFTFEVSDWHKRDVYGWYHIGEGCTPYDNIEDLDALLSGRKNARIGNEILFRKFR